MYMYIYIRGNWISKIFLGVPKNPGKFKSFM
jgi:hypothetical protein